MKRFLVSNIVEQVAVKDVQEAYVYERNLLLLLHLSFFCFFKENSTSYLFGFFGFVNCRCLAPLTGRYNLLYILENDLPSLLESFGPQTLF